LKDGNCQLFWKVWIKRQWSSWFRQNGHRLHPFWNWVVMKLANLRPLVRVCRIPRFLCERTLKIGKMVSKLSERTLKSDCSFVYWLSSFRSARSDNISNRRPNRNYERYFFSQTSVSSFFCFMSLSSFFQMIWCR
jgi:hypothetical protein